MGITRDSRHKRSASGARPKDYKKKRAHEKGRQTSNTRIGPKRIHTVRVRGGNLKFRALRLESGNFAWGSEHITAKSRILGVVFNASNNELVRTNTLVKNAVIQIDATPFRIAYEKHYGKPVTTKRRAAGQGAAEEVQEQKKSKHVEAKLNGRQKTGNLDPLVEQQFGSGRLYACISSRPGQSGRADGYILEGAELEHYVRSMRRRGGGGKAAA